MIRLLPILFLLSICCSCQSQSGPSDLTSEEQAKVERITKLAQDHGWKFDSSMTEDQITKEILEMDEEEFTRLVKLFDHLKKTEGEIQE